MAESILQTYKRRLKQSKDLCEPHWNRAIDNYKHYLARLDVGGADTNQYPFHSQMVIPISFDLIESTIPRFIGRDPEFSAVAVEPSDVAFEQQAKLAVDMAYNNPKLEVRGEPIYLKLLLMAKEGLITGNAVGRPYWRRELGKQVRYLASLEGSGIEGNDNIAEVMKAAQKMQAEDKVTYSKKLVDAPIIDDFDMRHLPFFHYFPDVEMQIPGRMRFQIEREFVSFEQLAEEASVFDYDKTVMNEIKAMVEGGNQGHTPDVPKDFMYEYQELFHNVNRKTWNTDDDVVPLLMVDKMWTGDKVHVFVNEKYSLTGEKGIRNPYDILTDPFIHIQDVPIPHSYHAKSTLDWVKKLEDGITDTYNMRFDNLLNTMLNIWLYNPKFISKGEEFLPIPNTMTSVTDVDKAVRKMSGDDVTAGAYREAEQLIQIVNRVTGVNDYVKGNEGDTVAGRTYGGLRLIQEAANARFVIKSRTFEKTALKSLGYFMLEMSRQFINKDRAARMMGDTGDMVDTKLEANKLKAIKGFMDIRVIPNSANQVDQQVEAMRMNALSDRFMSQKGPFNNIPEEVYDKFFQKILEVNGITDAVYWARARAEARKKTEKPETPEQPPAQPTQPQVPPELLAQTLAGGQPPQSPVAIPTNNVLQSDQGVVAQPDPLAAILAAESNAPLL